jgi:hypothetical protein
MARKNPQTEIDELREAVRERDSILDRIGGLTERVDTIETEAGLRSALDRIGELADGEDDADEIGCENCNDEGCSLCDDTIDDDDEQ